MKLMTLAVAVAATAACVQCAQARTHHHYRHHYSHEARRHALRHERWARRDHGQWRNASDVEATNRGRHGGGGSRYGGGHGGRPRAWCGWEMRQLVGGDPGPAFNLARSWARWGHAGPAGVGAVVVWPHHVGKIVGREDGMWVIKSGNDGHRVRTRPRSIAGAIAIRWG